MRAASQNLNIDEKQAEQFVFKFGMSKDKLEGQVYKAIGGTITQRTERSGEDYSVGYGWNY